MTAEINPTSRHIYGEQAWQVHEGAPVVPNESMQIEENIGVSTNESTQIIDHSDEAGLALTGLIDGTQVAEITDDSGDSISTQQEHLESPHTELSGPVPRTPEKASSQQLDEASDNAIIRKEAAGVNTLDIATQSLDAVADSVTDASNEISAVLIDQRSDITAVRKQLDTEKAKIDKLQQETEALVDAAQIEVNSARVTHTKEDKIFTETKANRARIVADFRSILDQISNQPHDHDSFEETMALFNQIRLIWDALDSGNHILPNGNKVSIKEVLDDDAEAERRTSGAAEVLGEAEQSLAEQLEKQSKLGLKAERKAAQRKKVEKHLRKQQRRLGLIKFMISATGIGTVPESLLITEEDEDDGVTQLQQSTTIQGEIAQ